MAANRASSESSEDSSEVNSCRFCAPLNMHSHGASRLALCDQMGKGQQCNDNQHHAHVIVLPKPLVG